MHTNIPWCGVATGAKYLVYCNTICTQTLNDSIFSSSSAAPTRFEQPEIMSSSWDLIELSLYGSFLRFLQSFRLKKTWRSSFAMLSSISAKLGQPLRINFSTLGIIEKFDIFARRGE